MLLPSPTSPCLWLQQLLVCRVVCLSGLFLGLCLSLGQLSSLFSFLLNLFIPHFEAFFLSRLLISICQLSRSHRPLLSPFTCPQLPFLLPPPTLFLPSYHAHPPCWSSPSPSSPLSISISTRPPSFLLSVAPGVEVSLRYSRRLFEVPGALGAVCVWVWVCKCVSGNFFISSSSQEHLALLLIWASLMVKRPSLCRSSCVCECACISWLRIAGEFNYYLFCFPQPIKTGQQYFFLKECKRD